MCERWFLYTRLSLLDFAFQNTALQRLNNFIFFYYEIHEYCMEVKVEFFFPFKGISCLQDCNREGGSRVGHLIFLVATGGNDRTLLFKYARYFQYSIKENR